MYKIRFIHPYPNFDILRQTTNHSSEYGDFHFYLEDTEEEYDYLVVYGYLPDELKIHIPQANTLFITGEPESIQNFNYDFLNQFEHVITSNKNITHKNINYTQQALPWHVDKTYDELKSIQEVKKTKKISMIVSNKQFTEGHKLRYEFAMKLKEHFGDKIDLFGRGINEVIDKWDALVDYEFSIAIENSSFEDYFTEKISDCYLAYTYPIYFGCPNITDYFDQNSIINIDINNLDKSIKIIEKLLSDDNFYLNHLEKIKEARNLCLDKYNFFETLIKYFEENIHKNEKKFVQTILKPEDYFLERQKARENNKYINFIKKIVKKLKNYV